MRAVVARGAHRRGGQSYDGVLGSQEPQSGKQGHQCVDVQALQSVAGGWLKALQEDLGSLSALPPRCCGQDEDVSCGLGIEGEVRGVGCAVGASGAVGIVLLVAGGLALLRVALGVLSVLLCACGAGLVLVAGGFGVPGLFDRVNLGLIAEIGILTVVVHRGVCVQGFGQLNGAHVVNSNVQASDGG